MGNIANAETAEFVELLWNDEKNLGCQELLNNDGPWSSSQ